MKSRKRGLQKGDLGLPGDEIGNIFRCFLPELRGHKTTPRCFLETLFSPLVYGCGNSEQKTVVASNICLGTLKSIAENGHNITVATSYYQVPNRCDSFYLNLEE